VVVIDTGADASLMKPGWHPYFHLAVAFDIDREREIGTRLKALGIGAADVKTVVLTHLHIDHDGGLGYFPNAEIWVSAGELAAASGFRGELAGYLPRRWPSGFAPKALRLEDGALGSFAQSQRVTRDGAIVVIPTPGHTPYHVSVVAETGRGRVLFTGDATYAESSLRAGLVDGVAPDETQAKATLGRLNALVAEQPTLVLPAHDPESAARFAAWGRAV
jgi:glyoxylase-like metal-dependent hydrolase (beta-lactamase superfamily II)